MITMDLIDCPKCDYDRALTHYSSCGTLNWIACPKCRTFFDHNEEVEEYNEEFWNNVIEDTQYDKDMEVKTMCDVRNVQWDVSSLAPKPKEHNPIKDVEWKLG